MSKVDPRNTLHASIQLLEHRQEEQWQILKAQLNVVKESAQPLNLLKSAWDNMRTSPDLINDLASGALGLTAGYLSKKLIIGNSRNPIRKFAGFLLQTAVSIVVAKKTEFVKGITSTVTELLDEEKEQVDEA